MGTGYYSRTKAQIATFANYDKFKKDGKWNVVNVNKTSVSGEVSCLVADHDIYETPLIKGWGVGSVELSNQLKTYSILSFTKKKKYTVNNKATVTLGRLVDCNEKNSDGIELYNYYEKDVVFYHFTSPKGWCMSETMNGTTILDTSALTKGSSTGADNSVKAADAQLFESTAEGEIEEDTTSSEDFIDTTYDQSSNDYPSGIIAKRINKFITKAAESSGNGSYDKEQVGGAYLNDDSVGASLDMESFEHLVRSRGIWADDYNKWVTEYNRMQWVNQDCYVGPTREFLFFTRPDLNIISTKKPNSLNKELRGDPFWAEMRDRYREIIAMLQYSIPECTKNGWTYKNANKIRTREFAPLLTNAVSGSLDLPGSSADTTETGATIYGTTIQYRKGAWKSDEGYDFSLEFTDSPELQLYHYFKMWEEYTKLKDIGVVSPPGGKNCNKYRINKILHDEIGIFKFIVAEDMETILYYAYLTGCFPKSVPRDSFGNVNAGAITYSIEWHAQFVEDMNPLILVHFNNVIKKELLNTAGANKGKLTISSSNSLPKTLAENFKYIPIYNKRYRHINGGFRGHPVIGMVDTGGPGMYKYVLRWYDDKNE
jgi:hypothetical protein